MRRFCPACGKLTDELYKGLCRDCFLARTRLISGPEKTAISVCACGRTATNREWSLFEKKADLLERALSKKIKFAQPSQFKIYFEKFKIHPKRRTTVPVVVRGIFDIEGKKVIDEKKIEVVFIPALCPVCTKVRGKYFEAVLQLRGPEKELARLQKDILARLATLKKTDPLAFVNQIKKVKGGIDLYLGSKAVAEKIARNLKTIYNLETKKSYSLGGMRAGKHVWRETILLRVKTKDR